MLYTNLKHIDDSAFYNKIIVNNELLVIICGKMDPQSVSVYRTMEELENTYTNIQFFDMEFNNPGLLDNCKLKVNTQKSELPFIFYIKNGTTIFTSSGAQQKEQIISNINSYLTK